MNRGMSQAPGLTYRGGDIKHKDCDGHGGYTRN